ncbi:MAG TPA: GNAT family N-acetyltransferase [Capsulimonadaceae bacterium]|jgi:GNAT superfamily N-acetyltransferase
MLTHHEQYAIDDDLSRVDFATVHGWLTDTYWSPCVTRELVERAARYSAIVIGVYHDGVQVGYARVVSDTVRFAYLADVYVAEAYRGQGIGRAIVRFAQAHPLIAEVPHVTLKTLDAQMVYAAEGFEPIADPENWMRWMRKPGAC